MSMWNRLGRRMASLATVIGTGVALPFVAGATPAHAAPVLDVAKFHTGDFARGETGVYRFQLSNRSTSDPTTGTVTLTDTLPQGLTVQGTLSQASWECDLSTTSITCTNSSVVGPFESYPIIELTVNVAADAPCTVTNTVTVSGGGSPADSYSDPTTITGGDCDDDDNGNGGGGSILPVNLNGVLPFFNNISTNSNINSPQARNSNRQELGLNAP
ncbi:hypothetical protein ABZZ17_24050 [Streptomyces sp. NPDC006512]|uniref:hypothetical protein n=1 Tax=Streptomyces sp. NPDC006512 TaxID=3154307 RepID=UPI0033B5F2E0